MILDKSKVSKNNQGIGYDFARSLRVGTHEIVGFSGRVIELAQKPITFKSAGFIGSTSSSTPTVSKPKLIPMPSKSKSGQKPKNPKPIKPVEKPRYECTFCGKADHLVGFCFRKARKERQDRLRTMRASRRIPKRAECACHSRAECTGRSRAECADSSRTECACHSWSRGMSRFSRRDRSSRRDLAGLGQNRRGQHSSHTFGNSKVTSCTRMT